MEISFTYHCPIDIKSSKFNLSRFHSWQKPTIINDPIIQYPMVFKLKTAQRMSNPFICIAQWMSKIIHRINAPFVSLTEMSHMHDTIYDRISHVDIWVRHVDLCSKRFLPVSILSSTHLFKQFQVFFN